MAWAGAECREIRFVFEPDLTQAYIFFKALGDCPISVQGWHHKTFHRDKPAVDIMVEAFGSDDALLWAGEAPPEAANALPS